MIEIEGIDPKMIANNLEPFEPTHPGELIKDEIECRRKEDSGGALTKTTTLSPATAQCSAFGC